MNGLYSTGVAVAVALTMSWLYIGAKSDLKAEIQSCNSRIEALADDGALKVAEARIRSLEADLVQKDVIIGQQRKALGIASQAATDAAKQPPRVDKAVEEEKDENACLGEFMPTSILDELR